VATAPLEGACTWSPPPPLSPGPESEIDMRQRYVLISAKSPTSADLAENLWLP
jgi:hypothetical protein